MPGQQPKKIIILFLLIMPFYLAAIPLVQYPTSTILKPIPIILLMLLTLKSKASGQVKGLLMTALGYSFLGDLILTMPLKGALKGGIVFFMLTHCVYIILYLKDFNFQMKRLTYFLPVLTLTLMGFYYLLPYLGTMFWPISIYLSLLVTMVFCAFQVQQQAELIISGACLFLLCDFGFALNEFILLGNQSLAIVVTLSYCLAQFLLVNGLSQRGLVNKKIKQSINPGLKPIGT